MKMGRERGVLRWDIHACLIEQQIEQIQRELLLMRNDAGSEAADQRQRAERLTAQLVELRRQLQALGPSPRAKMG